MASAAAPSPDLGDRGETVLLSRSNKAAEVPVSCRALRLLHLASLPLPPPPLFVPTWPPRLGFRGPGPGRRRRPGEYHDCRSALLCRQVDISEPQHYA